MIDQETGEIVGLAESGWEQPRNLPPFIRTPYNYDMNQASDETGLKCPEPTLTKQEFREETDINTIVERFGITGELPSNVRVPIQADFIEATDYHQALTQIKAADEAFMQLPADVRTRFNNDPGQLLDFTNDDKNREEAEKLGLVIPRPVQKAGPATAEPAKDTPAA